MNSMTHVKYIPSIVITLFLLSGLPLSLPRKTWALVDPLEAPNNKIGIHISDVSDIPSATALVNSSGGEWGYVTVVIREDQRNAEQWQYFFDELRRKKLIPIVRIATRSEGAIWVRPLPEDALRWAEFLNALNWVIKNRYVILFNEPNHAKEWGGSIDPVNYAQISKTYRDALKETSDDFFVLPAGVDISADSNASSLNPEAFYAAVYKSNPEYFTQFDGWTVHAYPNPNFSSPPTSKGRNSIWGYVWERNLLSDYGMSPTIPLFITETGWIHNETTQEGVEPELIGEYLRQAVENAWSDPHIVAVTPFILRYNALPFEHFSWMRGDTPLAHFTAYQGIEKIKGAPQKDDKAEIIDSFLPETLASNSHYRVGFRLRNAGQSIWDANNFRLEISDRDGLVSSISEIATIEPGDATKLWFELTAPQEVGTSTMSLRVLLEGKPLIEDITYTFHVVERMGILQPLRLWLERWFYETDFIGSQDGMIA